ncbi:unnamed protein product [Phytomonas sp. EM1]|nr:unnamed protein product [Phytomonas sp. EM1]|eukprot:CCW61280.1 unnamed protein product [Phytomonas sp. isolate EM1]
MDTSQGEFTICASAESPEDAQFDNLVGAIEDFMISFDLKSALKELPRLRSITGEHEQHAIYKKFLNHVESELNQHILAHFPEYKDISEVESILHAQHDKISEEVWDFISEGCFDYNVFLEEWKANSP